MKRYLTAIAGALAVLGTALTGSAAAPASSADINDLILKDSDVVPVWDVTDTSNYDLDAAGGFFQVNNIYSSKVKFTYTADVPVCLIFDYSLNGWTYMHCILDIATESQESLWYAEVYTKQTKHLAWLPAGTHSITFYSSSPSSNRNFKVYSISIKKQREEFSYDLLKSSGFVNEFNTQPFYVKNDLENPLVLFDGYLQNVNTSVESKCSIDVIFETEDVAKLDFEVDILSAYGQMQIYEDGERIHRILQDIAPGHLTTTIGKGTHIMRFTFMPYNSDYSYILQLKDFSIENKWTDIALTEPGILGGEILQHHEYLDDCRLLRLHGNLDATDWTNLRLCNNLKMLDVYDTPIEIIDNGNYKIPRVKYVNLPQNLKTIGEGAFNGYNFDKINIPATVTTIEKQGFAYNSDSSPYSSLREVVFEEGSQLNTLGERAFYGRRNLKEIIIPDGVKTISSYAFAYCSSLNKIKFPPNLRSISNYAFLECNLLQDFDFPESLRSIGSYAFQKSFKGILNGMEIVLPKGLTTIYDYAFSEANLVGTLNMPEGVNYLGSRCFNKCNFTKVDIPSTLNDLKYAAYIFQENPNLNEVILRCTSPDVSVKTQSYKPFDSTTPMKLLVVPDFALGAYKLDSYWKQFEQIKGEKFVQDSWQASGNVRLGSNYRFYGRPSLDFYEGSSVRISGDEPQHYNLFNFTTGRKEGSVSKSSYSSGSIYYTGSSTETATNRSAVAYLSDATATDADEMRVSFQMHRNNWYFFSLPFDAKVSEVFHSNAEGQWAIRYYDGAQRASANSNKGNWIDVAADGVLRRGQGYIAMVSVSGELCFKADAVGQQQFFTQPELSFPLEENPCEDNAANAGWNYVGNPYPTYFDIRDIDFSGPITIFDGQNYKALSLTDDQYALRPLESFFIQKTPESDEAVMLRSGRQTTSTVAAKAPLRKAPAVKRDRFDLSIAEPTVIVEDEEEDAETIDPNDRTRIVLNETASMGYETVRDAAKFFADNREVAQIWTVDGDGTALAINERPYSDGVVRLGVRTPQKGAAYIIRALRNDRKAWLLDSVTGIEHDLDNGDYTFTATVAGSDENRFTIRFEQGASSVEETAGDAAVRIDIKGNMLTVAGCEGDFVTAVAADGSVRFQTRLDESGRAEAELTAGVYVVTVGSETRKVIVK